MDESNKERPASPIDYYRALKFEIPRHVKGYVLARFALAYATDSSRHGRFPEYARDALYELKEANETGELQPPLDAFAFEAITNFLDEVEGGRAISGQPVALILSMALEMRGPQSNG